MDREWIPEAEEEEEKKPHASMRTRHVIETMQVTSEKLAYDHFAKNAEEQRVKSASGFQALLHKVHKEGFKKLSAPEKKAVWAGMKREMTSTIKRLMKLQAACGGTTFFMYAPPMALAEEGGKDDPRMFQCCRTLQLSSVEKEEEDKVLDPSALKELTENFFNYRNNFHSIDGGDDMDLLPEDMDLKDLLPEDMDLLSSAASSSNRSSAPTPGEHDAVGGMSDDEMDDAYGDLDGLPEAADVLLEYPEVPAPKGKGKGKGKGKAPAPAAAGKKTKKPRTGDPNELTEAECVQAIRIKKLFLIEGKSVMEYSCSKPGWMTYEGYAGPTEASVTTINQPGTNKFSNYTTSLSSFLDKGYYKNVGLTDLSDFLEWYKTNCSTKGPRGELKAKLGGYLAGCLLPIVNRWLFHFAAKHGGDEGDENARMKRVIKAFKDVVNPSEA